MLPLVVPLLAAGKSISSPVRVEWLGPLPRGAPAPHLSPQGRGYTVTFGRDYPTVNAQSTEMGQSSPFQLILPSGKRVTVGWVGKPIESPLCLRITGQDEPITFDAWYRAFVLRRVTGRELNELTYSMNRGFICPKGYEFFGLAQAHGKAYVGVTWYDPMSSIQYRRAAVIFQLVESGGRLTPVPICRVPINAPSVHGSASPPLMDSAGGDLLVFDGSTLQRLTHDGKWVLVRRTPNWMLEGKSGPTEVSLRGRYLLRKEWNIQGLPTEAHRSIHTILVMDAISGRKLQRYRWVDEW